MHQRLVSSGLLSVIKFFHSPHPGVPRVDKIDANKCFAAEMGSLIAKAWIWQPWTAKLFVFVSKDKMIIYIHRALMGTWYCHYRGLKHYKDKREYIKGQNSAKI